MMRKREEETAGIKSFGGHEQTVTRRLEIRHLPHWGERVERHYED